MLLIDKYKEIGNPLRCMILLIKLCEILIQVGKSREAKSLVDCNLFGLLEFPLVRGQVNKLLKFFSVEEDRDIQMN